MQALHDIFSIWGTEAIHSTDTAVRQVAMAKAARALATALDEKQDTVYRWMRRGRIPDTAWQRVIDAAVIKGRALTIADLHAANRPPKPRGRTAHKARPARRRRSETRAIS